MNDRMNEWMKECNISNLTIMLIVFKYLEEENKTTTDVVIIIEVNWHRSQITLANFNIVMLEKKQQQKKRKRKNTKHWRMKKMFNVVLNAFQPTAKFLQQQLERITSWFD